MKETANTDAVPPLRVGLTYNVKSDQQSDLEDEEAEFDSFDTVLAIKRALEEEPCSVELIEADDELPMKLLRSRPDIVFNIAEGRPWQGSGSPSSRHTQLLPHSIYRIGRDDTLHRFGQSADQKAARYL